jgi:A/G-specific adenine glycosylase
MITEANAFRRALMRWFRVYGRGLPWRHDADPYRVLVSEFMLQQTTVAAVVPYFRRWMGEFPTVAILATAPEARVLKMWEGLGYYSRARNLRAAARRIVEDFGGRVPDEYEALRSLPGVGPYTASAVLAFAFDRCVPVIDANIQRVIARLMNFTDPVDSARSRKAIESAARAMLPARSGAAHTAALMDLGSLVCRAGVPVCASCPVRRFCKAVDPSCIPVKRRKAEVIREVDVRGFSMSRGNLRLVRSEGPRWRGLWTLPKVRPAGRLLAETDYTVTRHRIRLEVYAVRPERGWGAFSTASLPAMPSPHRRAVEQILAASQGGEILSAMSR